MADVQSRVRERLRLHLVRHGAAAFDDPVLFAEVEHLLRSSIEAGDSHALVLPELLGDPADRDGDALRLAPPAGGGRRGPLRQAAPADAALPLAVRVQPRQLRAAA